jgi:phospholipase A1/A2
MKILKIKPAFRIILTCLFIVLITSLPGNAAEIDDSLAKCAAIKDNNDARLRCFDELANKQIPAKETVIANPVEKKVEQKSTAVSQTKQETSPAPVSVLERYWDLVTTDRRNSFVLRPYRSNYFLPVAYNSSPNDETNLEYDPNAKAQFNEAKFQLSFKAKIWEDFLQEPLQALQDTWNKDRPIKGLDLWIGYTQLSFWQLYNSAFSSPFRDTNYEPEGLLNIRTQYEISGLMGTKLQFINVGFNHQSNGRSKPLSRSWNRIVANFGLEKIFGTEKKDSFNILLKTWYRLPEEEANDDNPDITRYMGYGELWATLYWDDMRFAAMLRNNFRQENLGAIQLEWSIPPSSFGKLLPGGPIFHKWADKYLTDKFSLYFQYFNGYGEGLMDYNKSINRFSAGIMIAEWN